MDDVLNYVILLGPMAALACVVVYAWTEKRENDL